jgi:hypothetical protein
VAHCQAGDFQHQATTRFDDSLAASEEKSLGPAFSRLRVDPIVPSKHKGAPAQAAGPQVGGP